MFAVQFAEIHGLLYYKPVAGVYIWLRLGDQCDTGAEEEAIVQKCAQYGALIGSGADYAGPQPGWFRLTFALPEREILDALRCVELAMGYKDRFKCRWQEKALVTTTPWHMAWWESWSRLCIY